MFDAIIIGGSSAGLSAALILGRSLRNVVVLDDNKPANRVSHASHGFLTRDGVSPADLVGIAREQLTKYDTVQIKNVTAAAVAPIENGFEVTTADGAPLQARKLVLATGLRDELPPIPDIERFWGKSVLHCPYCDGYEVHGEPLVVYNTGDTALHHAMMIRHWTPHLTLCTDGEVELTTEQRALLARHNIALVETPVVALKGGGEQIQAVVLADGSEIPCRAMFVRIVSHPRTTFAGDLGCTANAQGIVQVDNFGRTSVPGVYAAGDLSNPGRSVPLSVAQGASVGYGINTDMIVEAFV